MNKSNNCSKDKKATGTREWASSNVNIQNGCTNDCKYCYAKAMAVRFGRKTPDSWKDPEIKPQAIQKEYQKRKGTIMFPTSHDITRDNLVECLIVLRKILKTGNRILIVSKPDPVCITRLIGDLSAFKDQILFRFTIGSANKDILKFWEPNAPSFEERLTALEIAFEAGFKTSVSCEPMLDDCIEAVIEQVLPLVTDAVWIGKPNRLKAILSVSGEEKEVLQKADELQSRFSDERIHELYGKYADNPKIKWKDSIKEVVGLEQPMEAGLDI